MENTKEIMENTKEIEDEDSICDLNEDEDDRYQYYEPDEDDRYQYYEPIEEEHYYKPEQKMSLSNGIIRFCGESGYPAFGLVIMILGILLYLMECGRCSGFD